MISRNFYLLKLLKMRMVDFLGYVPGPDFFSDRAIKSLSEVHFIR